MLTDTGWAKVNLALHIRARRADGYHELESLFAFAEHGDGLSATEDDGLSLEIGGPFAAGLSAGGDNLVMRAAYALRDAAAPGHGARLMLDKRLPVAAGIGGGSADAAAALRLLARLWAINDTALLQRIAADLGADVPACLESRTVRGEGRGDRLMPVDGAGLSATPMLLVNPGIALATGPVFARWDGVDRGALGVDWRAGRNDLEAPAIALVGAIGTVLDALRESPGVSLVRMSGSGATCFALFESVETRAKAAAGLRARHSWWCLETALR